ncbi:Sec7 domain-containing protein [Phakopsora pachyrhizi]|nr:Sec7 domain-containing protein [Phakopsora pachyrhizi]
MGVYLPKESQQIDRLMEVFSNRYMTCNPRLCSISRSSLFFSIFNHHVTYRRFQQNNRAKMTRIDYVKNTKIDGIPSEVLEYIYDNVTFTEFIFVDEDKDGEKSKRKESRTYPGSSAALSAEPATTLILKL